MPEKVIIDVPVSYQVTFVAKTVRSIKKAWVKELIPIEIDVATDLQPFSNKKASGEDARWRRTLNDKQIHKGHVYDKVLAGGDHWVDVDLFNREVRRPEGILGYYFRRNDKNIPEDKKSPFFLNDLSKLKYREILDNGRDQIPSQIKRHQENLLTDGKRLMFKSFYIPAFMIREVESPAIRYGLTYVLGYGTGFKKDICIGIEEFVEKKEFLDEFMSGYCHDQSAFRRNIAMGEMKLEEINLDVERQVDPFAWWVIDTCVAACRYSFHNSRHSFLDGSDDFIAAAETLRDAVPPQGRWMTKEQTTLTCPQLLDGLKTMREALGGDFRPPFRKFAEAIDFRMNFIRQMRPEFFIKHDLTARMVP